MCWFWASVPADLRTLQDLTMCIHGVSVLLLVERCLVLSTRLIL